MYVCFFSLCTHVAGNDFFKQKRYQEAVMHYTEAMKKNPKDPRVLIYTITWLYNKLTLFFP